MSSSSGQASHQSRYDTLTHSHSATSQPQLNLLKTEHKCNDTSRFENKFNIYHKYQLQNFVTFLCIC